MRMTSPAAGSAYKVRFDQEIKASCVQDEQAADQTILIQCIIYKYQLLQPEITKKNNLM